MADVFPHRYTVLETRSDVFLEQSKVLRINELAKFAKERELTDAETAERAVLRAEYIAEWRKSVTATMDNVYLKNDDGTVEKLQKK